MNRSEIYERVDDIASKICVECNAGATGMPESILDWMTDRFVEEETGEMPCKWDVMRYMCEYLQENC